MVYVDNHSTPLSCCTTLGKIVIMLLSSVKRAMFIQFQGIHPKDNYDSLHYHCLHVPPSCLHGLEILDLPGLLSQSASYNASLPRPTSQLPFP